MKISCVVPVYNTAFALAETLGSLLDQDYKDYEIIVVDDGSTDDIAPLKEYYSKEDKVVWITLPERRGAAYCRNLGNSESSGDVIAVCDAGDLYTQDRLIQIEAFFKNEDNDLFYSDVQLNTATRQIQGMQKAYGWDGESKPPISHPTVAYRKKLAMEVMYQEKSLDTDLYEFFMIDAYRKGYKLGYINRITCVKVDLTRSSDCRDIKAAKRLKAQMYEEYKIKVKEA